MVSVSRAFTRRNLIAIAIGILAVGVPLLGFNLWLSRLAMQQGQDDVQTSAARGIKLVELRVAETISTLDDLAARGVDGCKPAQLEAMRLAAFAAMPVKEIAAVAADGQTFCTHLGLPLGQRKVLSSESLSGAPGYTLDIIQLGDGQKMVRLRRKVGNGPNGIAGLMPASMFLPKVDTQGEILSASGRLTTRAGNVIASTGNTIEPVAPGFSATSKSEKYGFQAEIAMPLARVSTSHDDFEQISLLVTAGFGLMLIAFSFLVPRRQPGNPIAELEQALAAGEFVPYYQPIVDIRSGQLRGAEVLVRWKKPDGTLVMPGAFIPLAESSGLIVDMTWALMKAVCREAGQAIGRRPGMKISFNFAGQLFRDESVVRTVRNIFAGTPIKLSQVVAELTERDPIENFTETRQIIAALQGLGMRIAIDDVGTGHSGLSYMLKLGIDIIKIDKMFVDALGTDRNSTTIVETLVDLAHNMRMDVVAEGVETFEQVTQLRELGIRSAQGYVFAPPLPGSAFLQLVEAIDPLPAQADEQKVSDLARGFLATRKQLGVA
jgi:sensor c-di-GMP phosphodiesterase-like protein